MEDATLLVIVIATALAFDFTNGFHDTGNAMAPSIATKALRPRQAVLLSAVLNVVGAFLSLAVAATIATGIVVATDVTLQVVLAGLAGGIVWNLLTWLRGLPSSSAHALVGGMVGAVLVANGPDGVIWTGLVAKVLVPALIAPLVAILVAAVGTNLVERITVGVARKDDRRWFRWSQLGSASLISLAHGTNDAQKSMGIILLALIAGGRATPDATVPVWVILSCALAIALGTYTGGWRVIRTLGKGLVDLGPRQAMTSQTASAAVILLSSHFGYSLSTTHVSTGSIMGSGVGKPAAQVRWSVASQMATAWLLTVPSAAVVGGGFYGLSSAFGESAGSYVVLLVLLALAVVFYVLSQRRPVTMDNVNKKWKGMP